MDPVKYAVIIPDGAADLPLDELGGKTPFEAAETPNIDALALRGKVGTAATTPEGFDAGSDVCSMCLLGYDPERFHTGRAPLEAAAIGLDMGAGDWVFRVNLVTVGEDDQAGLMLDHSAGGLSDAEGRELLGSLAEYWAERAPELMGEIEVVHGKSYRGSLADRSGRAYAGLATTPPHEIPGEAWGRELPDGENAEPIVKLMELSSEHLSVHPINRARKEAGKRPANMAWIWGQGTRPQMPSFKGLYNLRGAMTTPVDLLAGIAKLIGWDLLDVPGVTSYHDNDYEAQGAAARRALDRYDIVCCHIEAPDEASHQGDYATKVASIEAIDRHIVGPIVEKLESFGDPERDPEARGWRALIMPDHYTLVSTRRHDPTPVPFAVAGSWVRSVVNRRLTEAEAEASDLHVDPGHELMEFFLRGGLAGVR